MADRPDAGHRRDPSHRTVADGDGACEDDACEDDACEPVGPGTGGPSGGLEAVARAIRGPGVVARGEAWKHAASGVTPR